jgi:hypothetical protein
MHKKKRAQLSGSNKKIASTFCKLLLAAFKGFSKEYFSWGVEMVERSNARWSLGPYFRFRNTLDREDGGSNPPQGTTKRNGSVSVKTERNGSVGKKSLIPLYFNFCRRRRLLQTTWIDSNSLSHVDLGSKEDYHCILYHVPLHIQC